MQFLFIKVSSMCCCTQFSRVRVHESSCNTHWFFMLHNFLIKGFSVLDYQAQRLG
jgi:hypothetical protein